MMDLNLYAILIACGILILAPEIILLPVTEMIVGVLISRKTKSWMEAQGYQNVAVKRKIPRDVKKRINLLKVKWSWVRYVEFETEKQVSECGYVIIRPFCLSCTINRRNLVKI